jgi:hypothetical protein
MLKQSTLPALSGASLALALALCGGPQAMAKTSQQTTQPAAAPDAAPPAAPLRNPLNRNPDPRDSTIRPVTPPGSDSRDTVLSPPDAAPQPGSTPARPVPVRP